MAIIIFDSQVEYNKFYNRLRKYAEFRLSRYNIAFKDDARDKAMDKIVDWLLTNPEVDDIESFAKRIIINSIKDSIKLRKVEPSYLDSIRFDDESSIEYRDRIGGQRAYQIVKIKRK